MNDKVRCLACQTRMGYRRRLGEHLASVRAEHASLWSVGMLQDFLEHPPSAKKTRCVGGQLYSRPDLPCHVRNPRYPVWIRQH